MKLRVTQFARATGETPATVRNALTAGNDPRYPGADDFTGGGHRLFGWHDAIAWRLTRQLTETGLTWAQASEVVRETYAARQAEKLPNEGRLAFLAVWGSVTQAGATTGAETGLTSWIGPASEVGRVVTLDAASDATGAGMFTGLSCVRMVSIHRAIQTAKLLARRAGYGVYDGHLVALDMERAE